MKSRAQNDSEIQSQPCDHQEFKELETFQFVPGTKIPDGILALMKKPVHERILYPRAVQRKLHDIDAQLFSHLEKSLTNQDIDPQRKIEIFQKCLDDGLNAQWVKEEKSLIQLALEHGFRIIVTKLLGNPEIDIYGWRGQDIYNALSKVEFHNPSDIEWFVETLCQLGRLGWHTIELIFLSEQAHQKIDQKALSPETAKKLDGLLTDQVQTLHKLHLTTNTESALTKSAAAADPGNKLQEEKRNPKKNASTQILEDVHGMMPHVLGFLDIHSIYNLPRVSKRFKDATGIVRVGPLVSFLLTIAKNIDENIGNKINDLTMDCKFSRLKSESDAVLTKEFKEYRVIKGQAPPPNILFIMKNFYYRNLFSRETQNAIADIEKQMKEFIAETLNSNVSHKTKEDYLISCLDHGLNINSTIKYENRYLPFIALAIELGFQKTASRLLHEIGIDVQRFNPHMIVRSFTVLSSTMIYPWEDGSTSIWVIEILKRLKDLQFPRMRLYFILKSFPLGNLCCHDSFDDQRAKDIFSILKYISEDEKNIPPRDILILIESKFINILIFQCHPEIKKCSPEVVIQFIEFQIELASKSSFALIGNEIVNDMLKLPTYSPFSQQGAIIKTYIKLLRLIFEKAIDQTYFLKILPSYKTSNQFNFAHLASIDSSGALKEFLNLMHEMLKANRSESFISDFFNVFSDTNVRGWNYCNYIAYWGSDDDVQSFNELLHELMQRGITAERVFASKTLQNDKQFIFSHQLLAGNRHSERIVFEHQNDLQTYAHNALHARQVFCEVLTVQNNIKWCFGHYICLSTKNNVSEHFKLLSNLLRLGISRTEMCDYFLIACAENESVWQVMLRYSMPIRCLMLNLLLQLIPFTNSDAPLTREEKVTESINSVNDTAKNLEDFYNKLLILLSLKDSHGTLGHYILVDGSDDEQDSYFKILKHLINKISAITILDYLLIKESGGRNSFLAGAWGSMNNPKWILEFLILIMNRSDATSEAADKVFELLSYKDHFDVNCLMAFSSNPNFDLKLLLELLHALQQKNPTLSPKISSLLQEINIVLDEPYTLEKCSQMSHQALCSHLPFKKIYTYRAFDRKLDKLIIKYSINTSTTDVFENTIVTLAGMKAHTGVSEFNVVKHKFYPHIITLKVDYNHHQNKRLVTKLNHLWPSVAQLELEPEPPTAQQKIYLNIEILMDEVLDSGMFIMCLQGKIQKNPLLLLAYQMEAGAIAKVNFKNDVLPKLKSLPLLKDLVTDVSIRIPCQFFSTIIGETLAMPSQLTAVEKKEAEDTEAIALLELQFPDDATPPTIEVVAERINLYFKENFCARAFNQQQNTYFIAISKQFLVSEKFTRCFYKSEIKEETQIEVVATNPSGLGTIPALFIAVHPKDDAMQHSLFRTPLI